MVGKFLKGLLTGTLVSFVVLTAVSVYADLPPSMSMLDLIKIRASEVHTRIQEFRDSNAAKPAEKTPAAQAEEPPSSTAQAPTVARSSPTTGPVIKSMSELLGSPIDADIATSPDRPSAPDSATLTSGFGS